MYFAYVEAFERAIISLKNYRSRMQKLRLVLSALLARLCFVISEYLFSERENYERADNGESNIPTVAVIILSLRWLQGVIRMINMTK